MRRLLIPLLVLLLAVAAPAMAEPKQEAPPRGQLEAYTATVDPGQLEQLRLQGLDLHEHLLSGAGAQTTVQLVLTPDQALEVQRQGIALRTTSQLALQQVPNEGVFRPYSGPGGLAEELREVAAANPDTVKLVVAGRSVEGQEILALRVTRDAQTSEDGSKPAVLYASTQHAREWITPEVTRRLLHHYVDNDGTDPLITQLIDDHELWFVVVANPDGYDYTHSTDRLWRKNLRDNNGDGQITAGDGVDLNRNFPGHWGYDNEGSSSEFDNETYRGPSPASEPETQAFDGLLSRVGFEYLVNYHSAAELNLYGIGWQVATPTPDDNIYITLAGDDTQPGIPDYDPDLSAELYTTNGETTDHAHEAYGTLAFTPELGTCQRVSPNPETCDSVFNFPDDEDLIQAEFEKNLPFALDVAQSAADPGNPVSHLGRTTPDFNVDEFATSFGGPQLVQTDVDRDLGPVSLEYRINGGAVRTASTFEWQGGSRYGDTHDIYYRRVRGRVMGAVAGDSVEVVFRAGGAASEAFTYAVESDTDNPVLVLVNEDYTGFDPPLFPETMTVPPTGETAPRHLAGYTAALDANGVGYDVFDIDAQGGAPHHLGVLDHYEAVVWYTGDNAITQEEPDTDVLGFPFLGVADKQQAATIAVRDYLNDGGKLLHTGENAGNFGDFGLLFYGDDDQPDQPCAPEGSIFDDCLLYSDDFYQYWLGAYSRSTIGAPPPVAGTAGPFAGLSFPVTGGDGADNQDQAGIITVTSDVLPPEQYPTYADSARAAEYVFDEPQPDRFQPRGQGYAGVLHANRAYARLTRTIDLAGATSGNLSFAIDYNTEPDYDYVAVEAHTVGSDADWTTLEDLNGNTTTEPGASCTEGLIPGLHPQSAYYYTYDGTTGTCTPTGTTGEWHAFNNDSGGYQDVSFDLSAFAGAQVEVSIAYITDQGVGGVGAFVDDAVITVDGNVMDTEDFDEGLGAWSVPGPPPGSPANFRDWQQAGALVDPPEPAAAVTTDDSVFLPFGLEGISSAGARADVMDRALNHLGVNGSAGFDSDPTTSERIAGDTAAATAIAISQQRFAVDAADHAVVSRDDEFSDSLAGGPLTGEGPILYTSGESDELDDDTAGEIDRVLTDGQTVYLLGGVDAIGAGVADELAAAGYQVERLAGPSRVETAIAVADEVRSLYPDSGDVAIARAYGIDDNPTSGWADSVTGGAWAADERVPILVTPSDAVHPAVAAWLDDDGPERTVLLGGPIALTEEVEAAVQNAFRVAGADRFGTAAQVARQLWGVDDQGARRFVVIDGYHPDGWIYGLAAAGLAADSEAPLLMVNQGIPQPTRDLVDGCGEPMVDLLVVGGQDVIADQQRDALDALDGNAC